MQLRDYQKEGVKWLCSHSHTILGDEMGLGKTVQVTVAMDLLKCESILVLCNAAGRHVWEDLIDQWSYFGHDINVIESLEDPIRKRCVNVLSYSIISYIFGSQKKLSRKLKKLARVMKDTLLSTQWDVTICDEAHSLKNLNAIRTNAVLSQKGIQGTSKRMWFVSGTIMPNQPGELWPVLAAVGAPVGDYQPFINKYCTFGKFSRFQPEGTNPSTINELKELVGKHMIRRLKKDVTKQLPSLSISVTNLPSNEVNLKEFFSDAIYNEDLVQERIDRERETIRKVWTHFISNTKEDSIDSYELLKTLKSLEESAPAYRRWKGVVKMQAIVPIIINELESKGLDKIVIFAHHRCVVRSMKKKLEKYRPQIITGDTTARMRKRALTNFSQDKESRVFIGNIKAAGESIDLTAACEIIIVEPSGTPAVNAQAIMRCHRFNQTRPVRARIVRIKDFAEEAAMYALRQKTDDIANVMGDVQKRVDKQQ